MKKPKIQKLQKIRLIFLALAILSGSFIAWTLIKLVPVVVMLAAVITNNPVLIASVPSFVYFWFALNITFIASLTIMFIIKFYPEKKRI